MQWVNIQHGVSCNAFTVCNTISVSDSEMTFIVSGGALNSTHSLTQHHIGAVCCSNRARTACNIRRSRHTWWCFRWPTASHSATPATFCDCWDTTVALTPLSFSSETSRISCAEDAFPTTVKNVIVAALYPLWRHLANMFEPLNFLAYKVVWHFPHRCLKLRPPVAHTVHCVPK